MSETTSGDLARPEDGSTSPFEAIRRVDENGEHWDGRGLQFVMTYAAWRDFANVIERAKIACRNSGHDVTSNFAQSRKISGTKPGSDYRLSRYACYLIAMEADPNKKVVARAKTYFAVKTRKAEIAEQAPQYEIPQSFADALRLAAEKVEEAEQERAARQIESAARVIAEQERDALAPAAESWERLVDASGDYDLQAAAHMLCRDPDIKIGSVRLSRLLRKLGWIDGKKTRPYQQQINNGRLVAKVRRWTDPDTDEQHVTYQARITAKGLHDLRGHLLGVKPLQLRFDLVEGDDDEDGVA